MTGQVAGSMQWTGQSQSAKETYRVPSSAWTSYGVPGPAGTARGSTTRPGQRAPARRSSHWYMRCGMRGDGTIASGGSAAAVVVAAAR